LNNSILCLLLAVSITVHAALPSLAQTGFYGQAVKEYKSHHYEQAASLFDQYLATKFADKKITSTQLPLASEEPSIAYAIFYEGVCLEQIGDLNNARALYKLVAQRYKGTQLAAQAEKLLQHPKSSKLSAQRPAVLARDPSLDFFPKETWVSFKRFGNLMLVDGSINGRSTGMLFDTGAAGCLFSRDQLKSLGVEIPTGAPTAAIAGVGVNRQTPAWTMNADIRLGRIQRRKFPVQINDNPLNYPLLGMNFVEGLEYTIDNDANVIQFKSKNSNAQSTASVSNIPDKMFINVDSSSHYVYNIPFTESKGAIIVKAKVADKECRMILDTGTDICLFPTAQLKILGIVPKYTGRMLACKGAAGYMKAPLCVFEKAEFGPISGQMVCLISEDAYLPLPLLGQNFLKGWQLTVDHSNRLIKLIRK
jgi:predicted aspartyl protease